LKSLLRNTVLSAGALAAGLFTASLPAMAADEIVIGLSYGRTGLYSTINKTTEVAVDIATAEINAAGGINGKKVRIVKFDTAGDPKQAVVAVRKFARDDKALAVIGPFSSSEARVAFAAGEREKNCPDPECLVRSKASRQILVCIPDDRKRIHPNAARCKDTKKSQRTKKINCDHVRY